MSEEQKRPVEVESWHAEMGKGFFVNGEEFPYWVLADGPLVEAVDDHMHILWLPLIANGPCPRAGRPCGEPAPHAHPATTPPTDAAEAAGGADHG